MTIKRALIKTDGTVVALENPQSIDQVSDLIGAESFDSVSLHHMGYPLHVMIVDDFGLAKDLPVNHHATILYHLNCKPGTATEILGDVVILPDSDFSEVR